MTKVYSVSAVAAGVPVTLRVFAECPRAGHYAHTCRQHTLLAPDLRLGTQEELQLRLQNWGQSHPAYPYLPEPTREELVHLLTKFFVTEIPLD